MKRSEHLHSSYVLCGDLVRRLARIFFAAASYSRTLLRLVCSINRLAIDGGCGGGADDEHGSRGGGVLFNLPRPAQLGALRPGSLFIGVGGNFLQRRWARFGFAPDRCNRHSERMVCIADCPECCRCACGGDVLCSAARSTHCAKADHELGWTGSRFVVGREYEIDVLQRPMSLLPFWQLTSVLTIVGLFALLGPSHLRWRTTSELLEIRQFQGLKSPKR